MAGEKQFSFPLASYNQAQINAITQAVADINTLVTAIKNTDIANLATTVSSLSTSVGNITSIERFKPFGIDTDITVPAGSGYTDVINIASGKGYLTEFVCLDADATYKNDIHIVVDGTDTYDITGIVAGVFYGLTKPSNVMSSSSGQFASIFARNWGGTYLFNKDITSTTLTKKKYTANMVGLLLTEPIAFKTSLLVQLKQVVGHAVNTTVLGNYSQFV